ncbi:unnamed protein product [Hymenolepis diminuta]|uniref:Transcription initiation factor IIA subunit 2 n=1 Tax=Hymenolepis diminuta TaxID=6216 RepID=A0A0R3S8K6_HYMDI|nr:unnamed protein product [Hymenolepis diminuta]VUZ46216.1 unnamed protein product [Hymenolepis diminuta]
MSEEYHQLYRGTTIGSTLQESLDEMLDHNLIKNPLAMKVMKKFDQCICNALSTQVKNRLNLQGYLNAYRNCDNVWTLVLNNVEIKDGSSTTHVDKMKIVACEGKKSKNSEAQGSQKQNINRTGQNLSGPQGDGDLDED